MLSWIRAHGGGSDIELRRPGCGRNRSPAQAVTTTPTENDVEPHPLVGTASANVKLYRGRDSVGTNAFDIVRDAHVAIDAIRENGFDR